jgi:hypothetical protein
MAVNKHGIYHPSGNDGQLMLEPSLHGNQGAAGKLVIPALDPPILGIQDEEIKHISL